MVLAACWGGDDEIIPDGPDAGMQDDDPPAITSLTITENPNSVLAATIEIETDVATTAVVEVDGGDHGMWTIPYDSGAGTSHVIPVLGLRAENHYELTVTVSAGGLDTVDDSLTFDSAALPADFPPIEATVHDAANVAPGVTVFNVSRWNPGVDDQWAYLIGIDEQGEVVWYQKGAGFSDVELMSTDLFATEVGDEAIVELDAMGEQHSEWTVGDVGVDTFHHEVHEMPGGNLATLSTELQTIDGYEGGTVSHDVVGDVIVEFDRDGVVVKEYTLFDILDPLRTRPGFDAGFWDEEYPEATEGTKDWTHSNSVIYDDRDDSYIVSVRHQDWVIKVDRDTGNLVWRLGEEGDFTMTGTGEWQFHQHAPEIQDSGTLLIYDNGNARTGLTGDPFTRVVEYELDTQQMEVTQVWEYRNDTPYYAPFVGDVDRLSNGNVLITDGGIVDDPNLGIPDPDNLKSARILEVTHDSPVSKIWEVVIRDESASDPIGYHVYRADRFESLYDAVQ